MYDRFLRRIEIQILTGYQEAEKENQNTTKTFVFRFPKTDKTMESRGEHTYIYIMRVLPHPPPAEAEILGTFQLISLS